jgi:hypothetical protein
VAQPVIRHLQRPGLPPATDPSSFVVPDRPSPPIRPDDKVILVAFQLWVYRTRDEAWCYGSGCYLVQHLTFTDAVQDGHYVFELGDNLTSRCKYWRCLVVALLCAVFALTSTHPLAVRVWLLRRVSRGTCRQDLEQDG